MTLCIFRGTAAHWDDLVFSTESSSPYHLSMWSNIRESSDWIPLRLWDYDNQTGIQCLIKRLFGGITVVWAPLITVSERLNLDELFNLVASDVTQPMYFRVGIRGISKHSYLQTSSLSGWRATGGHLGAPETIDLTILNEESDQLNRCSKNWKRNLSRGYNRKLFTELSTLPDVKEIAHAVEEMYELKSIRSFDWRTRASHLQDYFGCTRGNLSTVVTRSEKGELLAVRSALIIANRAYDMIAVTTPLGRKCYASHVTMWELINDLRRRRVTSYDLGGVDSTTNPGVANFKSGLGGNLVPNDEDLHRSKPMWLLKPLDLFIRVHSKRAHS